MGNTNGAGHRILKNNISTASRSVKKLLAFLSREPGPRPGGFAAPWERRAPAATASFGGDGFRAVKIEFRRLCRFACMDLNDERHAGRPLQEDRFVLNPVGAKDKVGERSVGGDRLTGAAGLRQIDDRGRVFGRGVLSPSKVKSIRRPVAVSPPRAPPLGASTRLSPPLTRSSDSLPACSRNA